MTWVFKRTCQECFHEQVDKPVEPGKTASIAYLERKCRQCKSTALDYGSWKKTE